MKKILFISVKMGEYYESIKKGLEKRGYEVTFFEEASKINKLELTTFERIIRGLAKDCKLKYFRNKFKKIEKQIYAQYLERLENSYDYIFDLGSRTELTCLELMKNKINGKYILYIWDDIKYHYRSKNLMDKFDLVYTYSLQDSKTYNLLFRPNFYNNDFVYKGEEKFIDIFYIGSMRESYRLKVISQIDDRLKKYNTNMKLAGKLKLKNLLNKNRYEKYILNKPLPLKELCEYYKKSKVLLDINFKNQTGLGLRPIEAIGTRSKLITTNHNVKEYDFYNENNIFLLNKDLSNINKLNEFMEKPYINYENKIYYKYSIDGFIDDIFV